jgi:ABC-2 type transport system permease protein
MGRELPPVADQSRLFRRLRYTLFRNSLQVALRTGRLRLLSLIATSILVAFFTFAVSLYLFNQLAVNNIPFKGAIVEALFDLLFFTLGTMLLFSTGIILYASLFTSPEARYLLTTPARSDQIFVTKFQTAVAFSSWGFVILGVPIFVGYGLVSGVPWHFYALLPLFLLGYVLLPGSVSAAGCLLLVRYMPRNRRQFFTLVGLVLGAVVAYWLYKLGMGFRKSLITSGRELDDLIGQFDLMRSGLAPSHWMTRGVMAAARDDLPGAFLPLAMVWSNGLLLFVVATGLAQRLYRPAYDRLSAFGRGKKIYGTSLLDRLLLGLVFYLDKPTQVLVIKDFRTFRRDPTQWVILLIFGGLMLLGASNFRQYYAGDFGVMDRYAISLMNLCGTSVLLCAGLSRFVFPLISLEGRKFWILGLMPISRDQILYGKFAFAATGSLVIAEFLILSSDILLMLPLAALLLHAVTVAAIAIGLSALNVGLGAYLPNFRETDPSKIVVGFGGTVNMVVGLAFVVVVIGLMVVPFHTAQLAQRATDGAARINPWVYVGIPLGVILSVLAVVLPLRAGIRSLRAMEF